MDISSRIKNLVDAFHREDRKNGLVETENSRAMEAKLLTGKNVLVTGAGQNIGKSIAVEMAKQGARVFFTDIDRKKIESLEKELSEYGHFSKGFVSDISRHEEIDDLYSELTNAGVQIDILINNVGIQSRIDSIFDFDKSDWEKTFNVNLFGPMYLTSLVVKKMRSNEVAGSVLFITSVHQWAVRTVASYSASKAALGMVVKELALDLAPYGIRVNGIAPGWVAEDSEGKLLKHPYCPLHKTSIRPCYIGRAAVYISSDYFSRQTTGTVIKIDGGLSLWNHCCEQKQSRTGL
jgi:3-oxoacyl-[acyl-carrier protein] reductase